MLKRFIALASTALALAASFYGHIATIRSGAGVGSNRALAVEQFSVVTSSGTHAEGGRHQERKGSSISVRFGNNPTHIRNVPNPPDEYVAYRHVFAQIYFEAQEQRKTESGLNTAVEFYKQSVPLSADEGRVLEKIALETEIRTLAIEEQAATIIRRFREEIDAQKKSGRKPSPEPPELQTLQKQRVRTTLQGRDELRKAYGESIFSRFDKFLKEGMGLGIEMAIP